VSPEFDFILITLHLRDVDMNFFGEGFLAETPGFTQGDELFWKGR